MEKIQSQEEKMSNACAISIIIPVYNAEKYIDACLQSILKQRLKDLEIICIDDGSTDRSAEIIDRYRKQDNRIRLYQINNSGAANARNFALTKASGEYITFLDADDYYPNSEALASMYEGVKRECVKICGGLRLWDYEGIIKEHPLHRDVIKKHPNGFRMLFSDFQHDYQYHSYIYSRELIEAHHIRFPNYVRYEDPVFFVNFMVKANEFYIIPQDVYCYRKRSSPCKLNPKATLDTLYGITENMVISAEKKYSKLHYACVQRINKEYCDDIINALGDTEYRDSVLKALKRANEAQDYSLLHKANSSYEEGTLLLPLQMYASDKKVEKKSLLYRGYKCLVENGIEYTFLRIKEKLMKN